MNRHYEGIRIGLHADESFVGARAKSDKAIGEIAEIIIFSYFSRFFFVIQMRNEPVLRVLHYVRTD